MSARSLAKGLLPPALLTLSRRLSGRGLRFSRTAESWAAAQVMSSGYDDQEILARVIVATRAVTAGHARFERDGVLFDEAQYPFAVLSGLLRAAALEGGHLRVVDFGGSLGSVYRQCRPMLEGLTSIRWSVIEQEAFVTAGRAEFTTDELRFERAIDDVVNGDKTVVLASSVLQYLEDPAAALNTLARSTARHLIIDRTPMGAQPSDRLCVQHVPAHIYPGSYPCWILSRARLMDRLLLAWNVVCDFPCAEGKTRTDDGLEFEFRGMILERKQ